MSPANHKILHKEICIPTLRVRYGIYLGNNHLARFGCGHKTFKHMNMTVIGNENETLIMAQRLKSIYEMVAQR